MLTKTIEHVGDRVLKQTSTSADEGCFYVARVKDFRIVGYEACYRYWTAGSRYGALRAARNWMHKQNQKIA